MDIFNRHFSKFQFSLYPVIKFMARFKPSSFCLVKGKFSNSGVTVGKINRRRTPFRI